MNKLQEAIQTLENYIYNPSVALPEEIFEFISRNTPLVNVDLLIKNDKDRTLLSWRDDEICGRGWHLPGGVLRYKESVDDRIRQILRSEITGLNSNFVIGNNFQKVTQIISRQYHNRGHHISFLFPVISDSDEDPLNEGIKENEIGYLKWFNKCPENLISVHDIYRDYI